MVRRLISVVVVIGLGLFEAGCFSLTNPLAASTTSSSINSIAVTGSVPAVGATSQFTATATMSDGTTQNVTSSATWSTSNTTYATVSSTGVVTGVTAASVTITATDQGVSGSLTILP